jgi:hypothetical protein
MPGASAIKPQKHAWGTLCTHRMTAPWNGMVIATPTNTATIMIRLATTRARRKSAAIVVVGGRWRRCEVVDEAGCAREPRCSYPLKMMLR